MNARAVAVLVVLGLLGYLLLPPVAPARPDEPQPTPTQAAPPSLTGPGYNLTSCSLSMYDYGMMNGPLDLPPWFSGVDLGSLNRLDLKYWNSGQFVSPADYAKGLDFRKVTFSVSGTVGLRIGYEFAKVPSDPLVGMKVGGIFDLPNRSSGFKNFYTGEVEWDAGIFAEWRGPGSWTVVGGEYGRERDIAGATAQQSGNSLTVTVPLAAVVNLGLDKPGVVMKFGSYSRLPDSVFDALPERGGIQFGFASQVNQRTLVQIDANNDRRNDLWYINLTGGDAVQAIADDKNNNGRIEFNAMEGPVTFRLDGTYMAFDRPQVNGQGRVTIVRLGNQNLLYGLRKEDRNGDGDLSDEGETEGVFVPRNPTFWRF